MYIPIIKPDYETIYRKADAETKCNHLQVVRRRKIVSDRAISVWNQCQECGSKVGPAIRKASLSKEELGVLPIWDTEIEKGFLASREKVRLQMAREEERRCEQEWERRYQAYLKTPEWQKRRQLVLLRAQGICEGCRSAPASEVHHLTYEAAGEEFLFQLVALCGAWHDRWHAPGSSRAPNPAHTISETTPQTNYERE